MLLARLISKLLICATLKASKAKGRSEAADIVSQKEREAKEAQEHL